MPEATHHAPCIAIVTDEPGWHGAELKRALAARGYAGRYVSLTECHIDLGAPHSVVIPGFGIMSFEAPEAEWAAAWQQGELLLTRGVILEEAAPPAAQ